jgi:hypothetical protein
MPSGFPKCKMQLNIFLNYSQYARMYTNTVKVLMTSLIFIIYFLIFLIESERLRIVIKDMCKRQCAKTKIKLQP